jgi:hypothetical protein
MFCREQAVQLHREREQIHQRGAELVMIGNGHRDFARGFRDEFEITTPLYVDTKRRSYQALGMKRGGLAATLKPSVLGHGARALKGGFRQGAIQGDAWQLGGVVVVLPGGKVAYRHLSDAAGDHPPTAEVLAALPPQNRP